MRNFNQGGGSTGSPRGGSRFGGSSGGGSRFGGGRPNDRGPVTMHQAICSKCGKKCEVPFRPTGDKPIYCNDCFSANRGGDRGGDRFPRKDFSSRAPMRNFSENRSSDNDVKKQLEFLGLKIDRLIKTVENLSHVKVGPSKEKSAEVKEVLKKVVKKKVVKKVKA